MSIIINKRPSIIKAPFKHPFQLQLIKGQRVTPLDAVHITLPLWDIRGRTGTKRNGNVSIATCVVDIISGGISGCTVIIREANPVLK